MRSLFDAATSILFALFIVLPLGSLALFGYSSLAENPPKWGAIDYGKFIGPDKSYRQATVKSALIGTPVGMDAIASKSYLDYFVFGAVNTSTVFSGLDGWLFYEPDLAVKCETKNYVSAVDTIDAMGNAAEAAGIGFVFSVSPDKTVVYPSLLGLRNSYRAACKLSVARAWRDYAKDVGSGIVDHLEAVGTDRLDFPRYSITNTHWNDFGRALAFRQLAIDVLEVDPGIPSTKDTKSTSKVNDLARLLRLQIEEPYVRFDKYWDKQFKPAIGAGVKAPTLVLNDSFYAGSIFQVTSIFPNNDMVHIDMDVKEHDDKLSKNPSFILINTVERHMANRVTRGNIGWNSPVGTYLLKKNAEKASSCVYRDAKKGEIDIRGLEPSGKGLKSAGDPQIRIRLDSPGKATPCVKISYSTTSKDTPSFSLLVADRYRGGMPLTIRPGTQERSFAAVFPASFSGTPVKFTPFAKEGTLFNLKIEIGAVATDAEAARQ